MKKPYVSVVIPAYNAAKYLHEAIDSILTQTYADFELIVINDGSTDNTRGVIDSYNDPRIVYLENSANSGICVTLNKGLEVARGRYIARMDADDIAMPLRLARQVAFMDAHPKVVVCGTDIEVFGKGMHTKVHFMQHTDADCRAGMLFNSCFAHPAVMIRKEVLDVNGLRYKEEYRGLEDFELWWQLAKYGQLANLPEPLLRYRMHPDQETQNVSAKVEQAFLKFLHQRIQDLGIDLSPAEMDIMELYATGKFKCFDTDKLSRFIALSRKIIHNYPAVSRVQRRAVKLTMAKAITFTMHNAHISEKQHHYNRCLRRGVFPWLWYAKLTLHNLLRH